MGAAFGAPGIQGRDQLCNGLMSIANDAGGSSAHNPKHVSVENLEPVIIAVDELLNQYALAQSAGFIEGVRYLPVSKEAGMDTVAPIQIGRLDDDRVSDFPRSGDGLIGGANG
jgi:hypothetical protein